MKSLLEKLIRAESTAHCGEMQAARVLEEFFCDHSVDCRVDAFSENRANITAHIRGNGGRPALLFASHLDVVPPGEGQWHYPPFDPVQKDGRIYGRGAADMKGGLTAAAAAIAEIADEGTALLGNVYYVATAGEETDSCGTRKWMTDHAADLPQVAGIVIPEPTGFDVVTAHRGILWLQVEAFGKTAHGSMPHLGDNAILRMHTLLTALRNYEIDCPAHPRLGTCSMSINEIHGGKAPNVVPDQCCITLDIRTLPGQSHNDIKRDIYSLLRHVEDLQTGDPEMFAVSTLRSISAMETDDNSAFVRSLCRIVEVPQTTAVGFTTDGPHFEPLNAPIVIFGPGNPEVCHKPDEYIELKELARAKEHYKQLILQLLAD